MSETTSEIPILKGNFDIMLPSKLFPAHKIIKPYYCNVNYDFNTISYEITITSVTFPFSVLDKIILSGHFLEEIELAAKNNSASLFEHGKTS